MGPHDSVRPTKMTDIRIPNVCLAVLALSVVGWDTETLGMLIRCGIARIGIIQHLSYWIPSSGRDIDLSDEKQNTLKWSLWVLCQG